jgi:hypothetical protein
MLEITFTPTEYHISQICEWLNSEFKQSSEGFFHKWNLIYQSFEQNKMAIALLDNFPIGFITWDESSVLTIIINYMEVHPEYRNIGNGRKFVDYFLKEMIHKNKVVAHLQSDPISSEPAWKAFGFSDLTINRVRESGIFRLYKVLVPSMPNIETKAKNLIELWNDQEYKTKHTDSKWKWEVIYKDDSDELISPIILNANYEWRIRWIQNGEIVYDGSVKRFSFGLIDYEEFIIILNLPRNLKSHTN